MNAKSSSSKQYSEQYSKLEQSIKGLLTLQVIASVFVIVSIVAFAYLSNGTDVLLVDKLKASVYGAALAIVGTILNARSMRRTSRQTKQLSDELAQDEQQYSLVPVFSGLLNKLFIVGGGIGFGLIIGLSPIYVIASYLFVQLSASARLLLSDN